MRTVIGAILLILCAAPVPAAEGVGDAAALERAWHGCVRQAFAEQPADRSRAAAQRGALDACRAQEDAYVALLMAGRGDGEGGRTLLGRTRAWVASVAATVVDPLATWIGALRR